MDVTMPQLGETVTEGTITRWFKQVGEQVEADEPLFEVSTDKVDSEVPAPSSGVLSEIVVPEGDTVPVGARLAVIGDGSGATAPAPPPAAPAQAPAPAPPQPAERPPPQQPAPPPQTPAPPAPPQPQPAPVASAPAPSNGGGTVTSPIVRQLIAQEGLDPNQIQGSGEGGRITRNDVLQAARARTTQPAPGAPAAPWEPQPTAAPAPQPMARGTGDEIVPFDNIRRRTAEHMVRSLATSAHVYTSVRVDFERIERVRRAHQGAWKIEEGFSLTYLPFIVRAFSDVVHEYPFVNASVENEALVVHRDVNLGVAIDLSFKGLIAPVIRNADGKRLRLIAREVRDLAARAKSKQLGPDEVVGGTFTITNMGPFGTAQTFAIINQPQVAILATDGIRKEAVVVDGPDGDDAIVVHHVGFLSLAWDHRAFDGAYAASFLNEMRNVLETQDWEAELAREEAVNTLETRWLGTVPYREAEALQRALHARTDDQYLLLQEHPHVYTLGSSAHMAHVLCDPASVGAELVDADRGGDVTYHGPGQLVGYPIVSLAEWRAGQRDVVAYVRKLEDVLIAVLADFGIAAERSTGYTGVWVAGEKDETTAQRPEGSEALSRPMKIAAIGVRVARGRTRHGFALNVDPDLSMFGHIVPCGISDRGVTSMTGVLGHPVAMREVVDRVVDRFAEVFEFAAVERADIAWERGPKPEPSSTVSISLTRKRPEWMRVKARMDDEFIALKKLVRDQNLHTVCEEAGCPNIYECWSDRTATFMILGERCTRACGFCLVDTRKPLAVDPGEPQRVADAIATLDLAHAVITCVARDDLPDGGASIFAATVDAVRATTPHTAIELLISDCKGDEASLQTIFDARPDVLNHNLETVARLQRTARPSAGYARSLSVLARAKDAGLVTKSGIIFGMGETAGELQQAIADLRNVGVDILTLGQYLQPSGSHLPVAKWWHPDEFAALGAYAESLGFAHVEAGPLVRSSYHARAGAERAAPQPA